MALQTSNTFNQITVDTRTFIDRAYGALKLRPQQITGEMQRIALDMINLVQQDLLNDSAPLWAHDTTYVPLVQGQRKCPLPAGTNDVVNAFLRTASNVTSAATVAASSAAYQFQFASATEVDMVAVTFPSSGAFPFQVQSGPDGATWVTNYTSTIFDVPLAQNLDGTYTVWVANTNSNPALYWRVIPAAVDPVTKAALSNVMTGSTAQVYNSPSDVLMYRMNRDDYWNMTNKNFSGRPLQFWLDRQITPVMDLWPSPDALAAQSVMLVRRTRYLMDPGMLGSPQGALQGTLEFPGRWYLPFLYMVAAELAFCTPEVDPEVTAQISPKAQDMRRRAFLEERDKSPVKFQAGIGVYTR